MDETTFTIIGAELLTGARTNYRSVSTIRNAYGNDRETGAGVTPLMENDNKSHFESPGGKYALTSPKPLSDAVSNTSRLSYQFA
ncbi:hypothetical protein ACTXT7_009801 [Hymenolepis weldensis]